MLPNDEQLLNLDEKVMHERNTHLNVITKFKLYWQGVIALLCPLAGF